MSRWSRSGSRNRSGGNNVEVGAEGAGGAEGGGTGVRRKNTTRRRRRRSKRISSAGGPLPLTGGLYQSLTPPTGSAACSQHLPGLVKTT